MTLDVFKRVLFNAGEQGVAADFNTLQTQIMAQLQDMRLFAAFINPMYDPADATNRVDTQMNQLIHSGDVYYNDVCWCPYPRAAIPYPSVTARAIGFTAGPLVQQVNDSATLNPDVPHVLMYWIEPGDLPLLQTAVGDATNPRIDLVQMKLEMVDGGPETRVYSQESVKASLDLDPLTPNVDTEIRARAGGTGGNNISIALVADGAGVGSLTASGNALTFHFQSGVTTVANFETAVAASDLIEIKAAGTGANVFAAGDAEPATLLTGGTNQVLVGSSLNKTRRVQATFSIKAGTPAAAPAYPDTDAGYVPICAVYVPATHNAVHSASNIRDLRMPLGGVREYDVIYNQINPGSGWSPNNGNHTLAATGISTARAICPVGGFMGRLIGVGICGDANVPGTFDGFVERLTYDNAPPPAVTVLSDMPTLDGDIDSAHGFYIHTCLQMMDRSAAGSYILGTRVANKRIGNPIWLDGTPQGPTNAQQIDGTVARANPTKLAVSMTSDNGATIYFVRFYIAHGMG